MQRSTAMDLVGNVQRTASALGDGDAALMRGLERPNDVVEFGVVWQFVGRHGAVSHGDGSGAGAGAGRQTSALALLFPELEKQRAVFCGERARPGVGVEEWLAVAGDEGGGWAADGARGGLGARCDEFIVGQAGAAVAQRRRGCASTV